MKVEDVMTRKVVKVAPGTSLKDAARLLVEHRISGLPVVDHDDHVLGVVSEADVLQKEAAVGPAPGWLSWLAGFDEEVDRSKLEARLVGEAMTSPAVTVEADQPVNIAAARMMERGVNRLPVIEEGKLVGIVTRADLVRAFVRSDADIAGEVREDVLVRKFWLDPQKVRVRVEDGEVTLTGTLENRADSPAVQALVRRVPGVVAVHADFAWADEDSGTPRSRAKQSAGV